uniref:Uncharacterized protein n=1 Tax=Cacopsylla melanoneura TaxID=428564 RepID=A0A8D8T2R4_9HEMI
MMLILRDLLRMLGRRRYTVGGMFWNVTLFQNVSSSLTFSMSASVPGEAFSIDEIAFHASSQPISWLPIPSLGFYLISKSFGISSNSMHLYDELLLSLEAVI